MDYSPRSWEVCWWQWGEPGRCPPTYCHCRGHAWRWGAFSKEVRLRWVRMDKKLLWKRGSVFQAYMYTWVRAQSCPTICDPMNCGPPGSSLHGISQARILEWVTLPFSRGLLQPRDWTSVSWVSCNGRQILYHWTTVSGLGKNICNYIYICVCVCVYIYIEREHWGPELSLLWLKSRIEEVGMVG